MIVNGIEVSPGAEAALTQWMQGHVNKKGFRASDLVAQIHALGIPSLATEDMRIADRLIQKHSRLCNIRLFGANNWCWVKPL
jgi:hypothetical protein